MIIFNEIEKQGWPKSMANSTGMKNMPGKDGVKTVKKYQVLSLEEFGKPVDDDRIETVINSMTEQSWQFNGFSTGGGGESGFFMSWVYMVFEKER